MRGLLRAVESIGLTSWWYHRPMDFADDSEDEYDEDDVVEEVARPTPEQIADATSKMEQLGRAAQKLGLFQLAGDIAVGESEDGLQVVLIATFVPGETAWADRTLKPSDSAFDEEFKEIERGVKASEFEAYRKALLERGDRSD